MYIKRTDYYSRITEDKLTLLVAGSASILTDADNFACGIIKGYLGKKYKIADEFAKTGTERNFQVLNWAIDIALYIIYQRTSDTEVPEKVIKNRDDATTELVDISVGKAQLDIERVTTEPTGEVKTTLRMGSKTPRTHTF